MKQQRVFRVIAALPLGSESGRKILNGVYRFLSEGYSWDIELLRRENEFARLFEPGEIDTSEFDGLLVAYAESEELRRKHAEIDLPTVFVDYPDPIRSTISRNAFVSDNEASIADTAVRHLLSTGLRASFGFVPARTPTEWSMRRGAAFEARLKSKGFEVKTFPGGDRFALSEWLSSLPKPTAVLAAYDDRAMDVLEACRHAELAVPRDVAVLGIGNDEILCEAATPPLSSVVCEFAAQGHSAARELQALMLGGRQRKPVSFGAKDTAVRASTLGGSPSAAIATRAMMYIRENALRGISTRDVVSHLRTSQRLAMLRFSEAYGKSMLETIIDLRIAEAKRLLSKTKLSVAEIALRSGFRDATAFRAVFTRRLGKSPRTFRGDSPPTRGDCPSNYLPRGLSPHPRGLSLQLPSAGTVPPPAGTVPPITFRGDCPSNCGDCPSNCGDCPPNCGDCPRSRGRFLTGVGEGEWHKKESRGKKRR